MIDCTQLPQQRKAVAAVTDGVSLSVSKSKLVYSSLIFLLTHINLPVNKATLNNSFCL